MLIRLHSSGMHPTGRRPKATYFLDLVHLRRLLQYPYQWRIAFSRGIAHILSRTYLARRAHEDGVGAASATAASSLHRLVCAAVYLIGLLVRAALLARVGLARSKSRPPRVVHPCSLGLACSRSRPPRVLGLACSTKRAEPQHDDKSEVLRATAQQVGEAKPTEKDAPPCSDIVGGVSKSCSPCKPTFAIETEAERATFGVMIAVSNAVVVGSAASSS